MEKYKKTVSVINEVGQPDQYGNKAFSITFADQTSGFFKCKEQDLFVVGQEAEFYMGKATGRTGKEYYKIQRVSAIENDFQKSEKNFSSAKPKVNEEQINRSVAIKAAAELLAGSANNTPERVIEAAEIFFDYIKFGVGSKEPQTTGREPEVITDELPF